MRYTGAIHFQGDADSRITVHAFIEREDSAAINLTVRWDGDDYHLDAQMIRTGEGRYETGLVHTTIAGRKYATPSEMTLIVVRRLSRAIEVAGGWLEDGYPFPFDDKSTLTLVT